MWISETLPLLTRSMFPGHQRQNGSWGHILLLPGSEATSRRDQQNQSVATNTTSMIPSPLPAPL